VSALIHRKILTALVATLALSWGSAAVGQQVPGCGSLQNAFGPFDYRDPAARGEPLRLVESAHFTPEIESLTKGNTGTVAGDLDYTLRAFPNHHRALYSISQYALRGGGQGSNLPLRSADCYFQRAIAFRKDDETVRMLYANYLSKRKQVAAAREQYEEALRLAPNSPEVNYNAGLFFLADGDLDSAKKYARVASEGGYPLIGLHRKIAEAEVDSTKR
jgi:tetratricopeptide (TPR) repeat protein